MRTTYLIKQHEKCIALLEMILRANTYRNNAERYINTFDPKTNIWDDRPRSEKAIRKYKAIAARLRSYYLKTIESITEKAIL